MRKPAPIKYTIYLLKFADKKLHAVPATVVTNSMFPCSLSTCVYESMCAYIYLVYIIKEAHRISWVVRDPWRSSNPTPDSTQSNLKVKSRIHRNCGTYKIRAVFSSMKWESNLPQSIHWCETCCFTMCRSWQT